MIKQGQEDQPSGDESASSLSHADDWTPRKLSLKRYIDPYLPTPILEQGRSIALARCFHHLVQPGKHPKNEISSCMYYTSRSLRLRMYTRHDESRSER